MFLREVMVAGIMTVLTTGSLAAQTSGSEEDWSSARFADRFESFDWLIGEWQGYGEFSNRTTYIHKRFSYEVAGVYFSERTLDVFPPPEPTTEFEVHQDLAFFQRDNSTGALTATTFFVETFVTTASVKVLDDGESFVVESTSIQNAPPGMRTRMTYTRTGVDGFELLFELAPPGGEYQAMEEAVFRRIR